MAGERHEIIKPLEARWASLVTLARAGAESRQLKDRATRFRAVEELLRDGTQRIWISWQTLLQPSDVLGAMPGGGKLTITRRTKRSQQPRSTRSRVGDIGDRGVGFRLHRLIADPEDLAGSDGFEVVKASWHER